MRVQALLVVAFALAAHLLAQSSPGPLPEDLDSLVIAGVSIGADYAGRKALCAELRAMSTRAKNVAILPDGADLLCTGQSSSTFTLALRERPNSADSFLCEFVSKPSALVFYQMRPIPLKSGASAVSSEEIAEKLQPLGVDSLGSLLAAFGFVGLDLDVAGDSDPIRQIGTHELGLLCGH